MKIGEILAGNYIEVIRSVTTLPNTQESQELIVEALIRNMQKTKESEVTKTTPYQIACVLRNSETKVYCVADIAKLITKSSNAVRNCLNGKLKFKLPFELKTRGRKHKTSNCDSLEKEILLLKKNVTSLIEMLNEHKHNSEGNSYVEMNLYEFWNGKNV